MRSVTGSNAFRVVDGSEKGGGFIFPPETASAAKNTQRGHFLPGMLFFFVLAAPSVAAETEAPRLPIDEVVVTATRDSQDPLKLAGNVTLIDRKSMQALALTRIADLLVQAPGT